MTDNYALGCMSGTSMSFILAALLVCAMYTCDSAERKGMCHEAWTYTSTIADTLATIRRGCSLPPTRTP